MSTYATPLSPGKTSPKGFLRVLGKVFTGSGVIESTALTVSAQLTPDMTVKVSGSALNDNAIVIHSDGTFIQSWNEADVNVTITANSSGVTKTDAIVAYVDLSAGLADPEDVANNPDSFKFIAVRRGGSNTGAPTSSEIATAVSNNPYIVLAHVTVANGASSINSGNITDQRTFAQVANDYLEPLGTNQYGNSSVTSAKLAQNFFKGRYRAGSTNSDQSALTVQFGWGYIQGDGTTDLNASLTFPTAFSSAPLMVIANFCGARTVASGAPTSMADFNAGFGSMGGTYTQDITTTGCQVDLITPGTFATTHYFGFTWIAIGTV